MSVAPLAAAVRSTWRSHVGRVRAINEDRVFDCPAAGLWAVADGMGGHRGGDLAAQAAVDALRVLIEEGVPLSLAVVEGALAAANAAILAGNRERGLDAGATIVVAWLADGVAHIGWVGDSRAYRIDAAGAALLTRDHSVVQELVDAGLIDAAAAARHPQANVVTRALGVDGVLGVEWTEAPLAPGERLLLCSDGLSRSLADVTADRGIEAAADRLLADALARDGSDNVSLVLVER